jgi:hypothetical protein
MHRMSLVLRFVRLWQLAFALGLRLAGSLVGLTGLPLELERMFDWGSLRADLS